MAPGNIGERGTPGGRREVRSKEPQTPEKAPARAEAEMRFVEVTGFAGVDQA